LIHKSESRLSTIVDAARLCFPAAQERFEAGGVLLRVWTLQGVNLRGGSDAHCRMDYLDDRNDLDGSAIGSRPDV